MPTKYPAQIDNSSTLPSVVDNTTPISASSVNALKDAIISVQSALGTSPAGIYSTVKNRMDVLEGTLNSTNAITISGDLSGEPTSIVVTGIGGNPISATVPTNNQVLTWNDAMSTWQPADPAGGDVNLTGPDVFGNIDNGFKVRHISGSSYGSLELDQNLKKVYTLGQENVTPTGFDSRAEVTLSDAETTLFNISIQPPRARRIDLMVMFTHKTDPSLFGCIDMTRVLTSDGGNFSIRNHPQIADSIDNSSLITLTPTFVFQYDALYIKIPISNYNIVASGFISVRGNSVE